MSHVPLMSDQDVENGSLPTYDEITQKKFSLNENDNKNKFFGCFSKKFEENSSDNSIQLSSVSMRLGFLRKVFGILAFQFIITIIFCSALYVTPHARLFLQQQSWIVLVLTLSSFGLLFAVFIHAYTVPLNYFLLTAWTILQAMTTGVIVSFYDAEVVLQAVFLTGVTVVSLFIYTLQSKRDFNKYYAWLSTLLIILIVATLLQIIIISSTFNFIVSIFGAVVFSMYLIFDIDAIMHYYSEEDYIIACLSIYVNIIGLFLRILEILNHLNSKNLL